MKIRQETKKDFTEIYNLIKTAFETARVSDGNEQDFAEKLRNSNNYIPELALVAEECDKIVGHIMLTKTVITSPEKVYEALLLAPISVLLGYRKRGVGSLLIKKSFSIAKDLGYKSVFLVGDPEYYKRFGFISTEEFGISNENNIPPQYVMACELESGALDEVSGMILFETI